MHNAPQGVINCDKFDHFDQFHIAVSLNILVAKKSQDYRSDNLKPSLTLTLCAIIHASLCSRLSKERSYHEILQIFFNELKAILK